MSTKKRKEEDKIVTVKILKQHTQALENHLKFSQNMMMAMARASKVQPKVFADSIKQDVKNDLYQIKVMEYLGYKLTSGNNESKHHPTNKTNNEKEI